MLPSSRITFPKYTDSGEQYTTVTERENDVWVSYIGTLDESGYAIVISLENEAFPHKKLGQDGDRIDITSISFVLDFDSSASGTIEVGVITRIDETDADIEYFMDFPFLGGVSKEFLAQQFSGGNSQLKCSIKDDALYHGLSNSGEAGVLTVNTGELLPSPAGDITPGVGDVIMKYLHDGGETNTNIFMLYHNTD